VVSWASGRRCGKGLHAGFNDVKRVHDEDLGKDVSLWHLDKESLRPTSETPAMAPAATW
jgi:hypothetical protein